MPIKPENRKRYPPRKVWLAIRAAVLERAGDRCEFCYRLNRSWVPTGYGKLIKIVLTTAHLDHTPENCDDFETTGKIKPWGLSNLAALCQRCHLKWDAARKAADRKAKRRAL